MKYLLLIPLSAMLLLGCVARNTNPVTPRSFNSPGHAAMHTEADRQPVVPYNSNSRWHLRLGRDYAAQGRYELAREHLLMALVSNSDALMREMLTHELKSVDAMIQTLR